MHPKITAAVEAAMDSIQNHPFDISRIGGDQMVEKWDAVGGAHSRNKYLDFPRQFRKKAQEIESLGIAAIEPPVRLLDIGAGGGHFCHLINRLGHIGVGLNPPDPAYAALCDHLGIEWHEHFVTPDRGIPHSLGRFDYITSSAIKFHSVRKVYWTKDQWHSFIDDLMERSLAPGGGIYFSFNIREDQLSSRSDEDKRVYSEIDAILIERGFTSSTLGIYFFGSLASLGSRSSDAPAS